MKKEQRKQHVQDVEKKRKRANRPRLGKEQKKARHHEDVPLGNKREIVGPNKQQTEEVDVGIHAVQSKMREIGVQEEV